MGRLQRVARNERGRDFAVGDIHGHFRRLEQALIAIGFDVRQDRLFSVGDLVDRGPESEEALVWLQRPWFYAVQGNHEALAVALVQGQWLDVDLYRANGGAWFLDSSAEDQARYVEQFSSLPLALEVDTLAGPVGLLHADCPCSSWQEWCDQLVVGPVKTALDVSQWSRRRLLQNDLTPVAGLRALIVGHTPGQSVRVLGNVWHIDTGGWLNGHFSFLDLAELDVRSARLES
ncbi:serine/threonine protein phosphatase [Pseudomonas laurentiana]|uniref:Serine/threonine protein phosphatase n=1 Tax=Pseudomonas laurentiana TaxID=2364649 RepID=A0A6I5RNQ8_9PSED|nr:metallophosphoesterase [Pseudomonas laurentiana]NES09754.1 serine/threonine protein phosphatase [Pseudomonas laurentiana]GGU51938.1 serine/threonine protein phosphatase [Pseudomonas laurentiana]